MYLQKFHTFNHTTKEWGTLTAKEPNHPKNRTEYSCVQCPENPNLVYVSGDCIFPEMAFNDVWRLDLNILHWEKLTKFTLPSVGVSTFSCLPLRYTASCMIYYKLCYSCMGCNVYCTFS